MNTITVDLDGCQVGRNQPCLIIAEAGVNHNGDLSLAHRLVDCAADAGADVVKFQAFQAAKLTTAQAPKAEYQRHATDRRESQFEMLKRLELTREMQVELMAHCRERRIRFLSSPFEEASADQLVELGLKFLKLPSGEITNLPFLDHVARKLIPVILSTGMASLGEVERAVEVFRSAGNRELVLLHCVSSYPANPSDCHLCTMHTLEVAFGLPVGFSDHTLGTEVALAAVALGARVIEKHLTLSRDLAGPDHQVSLEPDELAALVLGIRTVESALGDGRKIRVPSEQNTADVARKSVVAACEILAGTIITPKMLAILRPGTGLPPNMLPFVVGRSAKSLISTGTIVSFEMLT